MAINAKLSKTEIPEDDQRSLGDGIFPYTFGSIDEKTDPIPEEFDLLEDLIALEGADKELIKTRIRQFRRLLFWYQAIGTPLGFYLFGSMQAQSKLLQSCSLRLATHHPEFILSIPLFPWLRKNVRSWTAHVKASGEHAAPLEVLVKSLRTWLNLDKAIGVISGESPLVFRSARNALVLLDKWLGGTEEFALSLPQGGSPDDSACPHEAGLSLGTNALSHSAGQVATYLYLHRLEKAAKKAGETIDVEDHYAASAFELCALSLYDKQIIGRRPESEAKLLTYLAANDLAMFTPLHPLFVTLRSSMRWNDLHPGHRLQRIFKVIEDKDLLLDSSGSAAYYKFTSSICQSLNWPEVPQFIDAVVDAQGLDPEDSVQQLMKLAFAEREEHPTAFFDPTEAAKHLRDLAPAGSQLGDFKSSRAADKALTFAIEAEIYAAGFQLFFSNHEPSFVCPDYAEVVKHLHSASEMVQTYFGVEF